MFGVRAFCFCIFVLALGGCDLFMPLYPQDHDGEPNPWVGSWRLVSINDEVFLDTENEDGISIITNTWTFNADGTWGAELVIEFDIEEPGQYLYDFGGRYWLDGSNYRLSIGEGATFFETAEITTGAWIMVGDTLTLTDDEGEVLVLKRGGID